MPRRTWPLVLAIFLGSCVLLPANAFAKGCSSAICVYREQQPTPTGQQTLGQGSSKPAPLSRNASHALAQYNGGDKQAIKALATSPAYSIGHNGHGATSSSNRITGGPTAGTPKTGTFDLGAGNTSLFYLLAISAGLVLIAAGVRAFRR